MKFIVVYQTCCNNDCQFYSQQNPLKKEIKFELENIGDLMTKTYDIIKEQMPMGCEEHFKIIGVLNSP